MAENTGLENKFKVKLVRASDSSERVVFDVSPDIVENRNVNYDVLSPVHMPGQIYVYNYTNARAFNVNGIKLISRTPRESTLNINRINILRSWCMPKFGASGEVLGAPPAVLLFTAYSNSEHRGNIFQIPVVIQNFSFTYPSEPDYMPSADIPNLSHIAAGTPFPTLTNVDLQLFETHSPREYAKFSLEQFKTGNLSFF